MTYNILNLLIIQIVIIILLFGIVLWFIRLNRVTTIQKRYKRFCLEPLNNQEIAFLDKIVNYYFSLQKKLSKYLLKSKAMIDYSKKYQKYIDRTKDTNVHAIDYISTKVIYGLIGILMIVLSDVLRYEFITLYQIALSFLIGFFAPDIYWFSKNRIRKNQIDKDMLKAIIIMNNSFKSGLSIMQGIYMVSNELEGPVAEEFKRMYIDINFGLDMDIVFERFAKRINTEEAHYITASLSVLNKTGGNIVQVFASVERNAFTRKKLSEELDSLSASANAIYKILAVMPVILTVVIIFLNPKYFLPLFVTGVGRIILCLIFLIYISYIFIVRKIVKMKGY